MFTGLIEQQGVVIANTNHQTANRLLIQTAYKDLQAGESISINGVCLTLLPDFRDGLAFDVSPETLNKTMLGKLSAGDVVNMERAMIATAGFGGHYVSGHVDTTVCLKARHPMGEHVEITVGAFDEGDCRFLLPKGSITLDGISLTINAVENRCIKIMLVPHTLAKTTLGNRQPGDRLNVEFDYIARIVAHQLGFAVGHLHEPTMM